MIQSFIRENNESKNKSPAHKAKIRPKDIIVSTKNKIFKKYSDYEKAIKDSEDEGSIRLLFQRQTESEKRKYFTVVTKNSN